MSNTVILLRSPKPDEFGLLNSAEKIYTIDQGFSGLESLPHEVIDPEADNVYLDKAFEMIKHFALREYGGKKLVEHVTYKGEFLFYFTRFILINRFTPALKEHMMLEKALTRIPDDVLQQVHILHTSPFTRLFESSQKLTFHTRGTVSSGKLNKSSYFILFMIRALLGMILNSFKQTVIHLFLFPQVEPQPLLDRETLEMKKGNPTTDYFLEDLLKTKKAFILEERYPLNEGSYKLNADNILGRYGKSRIYFEPYLLRSMLLLAKSKLLKKVSERESHLFNTIMQEEKNPHLRLLSRIHWELKPLRRLAVIRFHAADHLFKTFRVKMVGCIDEYSVKGRSVLNAAMINGVQTYALQHGVIHEKHMGYYLLPEDRQYTHFPNKLFVYGQFTKERLVQQNYAVDDIIVAGQLRTDIIPILQKRHSEIKVKGITRSKRIILYASQPISSVYSSDLRNRLNQDFMALSKEFPNCQFILKPHPRETDHSYFQKLASQVETGDFIVSNADLYLLLSKCSMLLTHSSSVGQEAVSFSKPLVVMDYPDIDVMNYIRDGIGFKATNYRELHKVVSEILDEHLQPNKKAYETCRQRFTGPIDGKVSQRILAELQI